MPKGKYDIEGVDSVEDLADTLYNQLSEEERSAFVRRLSGHMGDPEETYGQRLRKMMGDLTHINYVMNLDRSFKEASAAQDALLAVNELRLSSEGWFNELAWGWMPDPERED